MIGDLLIQAMSRTSRRNGVSLAHAVAARLKALAARSSAPSGWDCWERMLQGRPGWVRVRQGTYEFKTGERLELRSKDSSGNILSWMAQIELKPLAQELAPELQERLLKEGVAAAAEWWQKHGPPIAPGTGGAG